MYADERRVEAKRYQLDPEDRRPIIDDAVAEPRG